jgi:hypothetical protein
MPTSSSRWLRHYFGRRWLTVRIMLPASICVGGRGGSGFGDGLTAARSPTCCLRPYTFLHINAWPAILYCKITASRDEPRLAKAITAGFHFVSLFAQG